MNGDPSIVKKNRLCGGVELEYLKLGIYQAIALFTVTAKLHRKEKVIYAENAGVSFVAFVYTLHRRRLARAYKLRHFMVRVIN